MEAGGASGGLSSSVVSRFSQVMIALFYTCVDCSSLSLLSVGNMYKSSCFEVDGHCQFMVVGWNVLLQARCLVQCVRCCGGYATAQD
jgi:hypothetical protein